MPLTLTLPQLGETMEEGRIVAWIKRPGDSFRRGEILVEVESDKTVVELPALTDGVLGEILAAEGAMIKVGDPIARYESAAPQAERDLGNRPAQTPLEATKSSTRPASTGSGALHPAEGRARATPKARRIARARGLALTAIRGTGRRSRIEARDVEALTSSETTDLHLRARREAMQGQEVKFCETPSGRIAYREWSGETVSDRPLIALHGLGGDGQTWALLASILYRRGRRVIAPDLPSHGATTCTAKSLDELVHQMGEFFEQLPESSLELVGHSLGGAVAARVALRLAHRLDRLTLIAPAGLGQEIDAEFVHGLAHLTTGAQLAGWLERIAIRPPVLSSLQLDAMAASLSSGRRLVGLAADLVQEGRQHLKILGDLKSLEGRVRLVWGLEDRVIPWAQAVRAGSGIPVHFMADAGHMPQWDQPEKLAALFKLAGRAE